MSFIYIPEESSKFCSLVYCKKLNLRKPLAIAFPKIRHFLGKFFFFHRGKAMRFKHFHKRKLVIMLIDPWIPVKTMFFLQIECNSWIVSLVRIIPNLHIRERGKILLFCRLLSPWALDTSYVKWETWFKIDLKHDYGHCGLDNCLLWRAALYIAMYLSDPCLLCITCK